jgi:hypothetical protein
MYKKLSVSVPDGVKVKLGRMSTLEERITRLPEFASGETRAYTQICAWSVIMFFGHGCARQGLVALADRISPDYVKRNMYADTSTKSVGFEVSVDEAAWAKQNYGSIGACFRALVAKERVQVS